jgi:hypothetical protein
MIESKCRFKWRSVLGRQQMWRRVEVDVADGMVFRWADLPVRLMKLVSVELTSLAARCAIDSSEL